MSTSQLCLSRRALGVYSRTLRAALDALPEAVLLIDERGEVLLSNRSFAQVAGLGPGYRFQLRDLRGALEALGATVNEAELDELLSSARRSMTLELPAERTLQCAVTPLALDEDGDSRLIVLREITAEHRERRELEHRALHDELTGLPSRLLLMDRVERALSRRAREGGAVGVVFLDLDTFKQVNDRHGHAMGDRVLVEVAGRLQRELREVDTVARIGGDEFVAICDGLESKSALASICQRIQEAVEQTYRLESVAVTLSASLGALLEWDPAVTPSTLIERADGLMYAAKRRGSHREIFVDGRPLETTRQPRTTRRPLGPRWLREALRSGQLFLVYLPVVSLHDQRTLAVEGLLRCHHPELAGLPPTDLLELVELAGVGDEFDAWVLDEAARTARALLERVDLLRVVDQRRGEIPDDPVQVVLNLSEMQLARNAVPSAVAKAAAQHDVDAGLLGFDISERLLNASPPWLAPSIAALRGHGCSLLVDDVAGPEFDAERLQELGFDQLKLDRPAIRRSAEDAAFAVVAKRSVAFARSLGLTVIGEGVDDWRLLRAVQELGCDGAQGYGFHGFPRPFADLLKVVG